MGGSGNQSATLLITGRRSKVVPIVRMDVANVISGSGVWPLRRILGDEFSFLKARSLPLRRSTKAVPQAAALEISVRECQAL